MDHICHRCNAHVEAGTPFCSQCGAPQIRVSFTTNQEESSSPTLNPASVSEVAPTSTGLIRWSSALPKAAVAGFSTLILMLGLGAIAEPLALLAVPLGAMFAVWMYQRSEATSTISTGGGLRIGIVTGFFSYVVNSIVTFAQIKASPEQAMKLLRQSIDQAIARNPQTAPIAQQLMTPQGISLLITITAVMFLFLFLILGATGGALGASIGKRR